MSNRSIFTDDQIKLAVKLWRAGDTMQVIGDSLGVHWKKIRNLVDTRRDMFPYRKNNVRRNNPAIKAVEDAVIPSPVIKPGHVIRTTITGAKVTMPRVIFIDGPEPQARVG